MTTLSVGRQHWLKTASQVQGSLWWLSAKSGILQLLATSAAAVNPAWEGASTACSLLESSGVSLSSYPWAFALASIPCKAKPASRALELSDPAEDWWWAIEFCPHHWTTWQQRFAELSAPGDDPSGICRCSNVARRLSIEWTGLVDAVRGSGLPRRPASGSIRPNSRWHFRRLRHANSTEHQAPCSSGENTGPCPSPIHASAALVNGRAASPRNSQLITFSEAALLV